MKLEEAIKVIEMQIEETNEKIRKQSRMAEFCDFDDEIVKRCEESIERHCSTRKTLTECLYLMKSVAREEN